MNQYLVSLQPKALERALGELVQGVADSLNAALNPTVQGVAEDAARQGYEAGLARRLDADQTRALAEVKVGVALAIKYAAAGYRDPVRWALHFLPDVLVQLDAQATDWPLRPMGELGIADPEPAEEFRERARAALAERHEAAAQVLRSEAG